MVNRNNHEKLKKYLVPGTHIHLVGIGGVSMRPLGLVLQIMGIKVTGSDMNSSGSTDDVIAKGIPVAIGHRAENIEGAACIIRTAAVHNDNPEIAAARAKGVPVFERAEAWGVIMQDYKNAICVSGTHGKTTTTSMITHILLEADWDPTVMIGGNLPAIGGNGHRVGHGDTMVLESCEYCDSFLNFSPSMSIILNIEADHLDYFKDLAHIQRSFREFAELSSDSILINGDDENTVEAVKGLEYHTFGLAEGNQIRAVNLSADWRSFDVECDGKFYCHVDISVLGKHNTLNALASAAAAYLLGIDGEAVSRGIHAYRGAGRRLEFKGHLNGADVYDDYAHHPKEVQVTLAAAREMGYKRLVAVFQPHTYSRTQALFDDFVRELKKADFVIVSEIYAAREKNTLGITGRTMAEAIPGAVFCETLPEVSSYMRCIAQEGDMMITLGCGDIYRAADALFA